LLFALSRFGGLRCPCEHLALKWTDIDWERDRFRVDSPKTGVRWVPIFPELRPYLEEAFELAPEGAVHVIGRYRDANANLRTQLMRIIGKAGLKPWPKLFHNLRATRETELAAQHPIHVVCAWIGHAAAIAQKHYLQVTDADFERACLGRGAESGAVVDVNLKKRCRIRCSNQPNCLGNEVQNTRKNPGNSGVFSGSPIFSAAERMPLIGLEKPQKTLAKPHCTKPTARQTARFRTICLRTCSESLTHGLT
jgi:hypothetical protein